MNLVEQKVENWNEFKYMVKKNVLQNLQQMTFFENIFEGTFLFLSEQLKEIIYIHLYRKYLSRKIVERFWDMELIPVGDLEPNSLLETFYSVPNSKYEIKLQTQSTLEKLNHWQAISLTALCFSIWS